MRASRNTPHAAPISSAAGWSTFLALRHPAISNPWAASTSMFSELAANNAVRLHARATTRLAGRGIAPCKTEAEPRPVSDKGVVIDQHTDARSILHQLLKFGRIALRCNNPVACFLMAGVLIGNAAWHEVISPSRQTRSSGITSSPQGCGCVATAIRRIYHTSPDSEQHWPDRENWAPFQMKAARPISATTRPTTAR